MRRNKLKPDFKYILVIVAGIVFSASGIYQVVSNYCEIYKLTKEKNKLLKENNELAIKIKSTDKKEFIEYNARIRLGLKKPDEIEYRFDPPEKK